MASRGTDLLTISGCVSSCRPSPNPSREALCTCSADRSWEFGEQETKASTPPPLPFFPTPHPFPFPPTHTHTHRIQPLLGPLLYANSAPDRSYLPPECHLKHTRRQVKVTRGRRLVPTALSQTAVITQLGYKMFQKKMPRIIKRPACHGWNKTEGMWVFKPRYIIHDSPSERIGALTEFTMLIVSVSP